MKPDDEKLYPSQEFDENEFAAEENELDFEDQNSPRRAGDTAGGTGIKHSAARSRKAGLTDASFPDQGATADDATPETLIGEDGARSPNDAQGTPPPDKNLNIKSKDQIGMGGGLDEEELADIDPLDGKP